MQTYLPFFQCKKRTAEEKIDVIQSVNVMWDTHHCFIFIPFFVAVAVVVVVVVQYIIAPSAIFPVGNSSRLSKAKPVATESRHSA